MEKGKNKTLKDKVRG